MLKQFNFNYIGGEKMTLLQERKINCDAGIGDAGI